LFIKTKNDIILTGRMELKFWHTTISIEYNTLINN